MITREQAEKAFLDRIGIDTKNDIETRILEIKDIASHEVILDSSDGGYDALGIFDIEERAWQCIYESRYQYNGKWQDWRKQTIYAVAPTPGLYIVD